VLGGLFFGHAEPGRFRERDEDLVVGIAAEQQLPNAQLTIVVETALTDLVGVWDANRLRRVVENLVANAVKYSPPGGVVTLQIDAAERSTGRWAMLAVTDQGLGIPSSDLPHIFERYYRATNVAGRIRGIGLGLAGSRQVAVEHGGGAWRCDHRHQRGRVRIDLHARTALPAPRTADGAE
jgi:signal transduction histidine kinase